VASKGSMALRSSASSEPFSDESGRYLATLSICRGRTGGLAKSDSRWVLQRRKVLVSVCWDIGNDGGGDSGGALHLRTSTSVTLSHPLGPTYQCYVRGSHLLEEDNDGQARREQR